MTTKILFSLLGAGVLAVGIFTVGFIHLQTHPNPAYTLAPVGTEASAPSAQAPGGGSAAPAPRTPGAQTTNLTEAVSREVSQAVAGQQLAALTDPTRPPLTANDTAPAIEAALSQKLADGGYTDFVSPVDMADVHIAKNYDAAAVSAYASALKSIITKSAAAVAAASRQGTLDATNLSSLLADAARAGDALAALPVPAPLAPFHAKQLGLARAREAIITAIAQSEEDPLRAALAVNLWPEVNKKFFDPMTTLHEEIPTP